MLGWFKKKKPEGEPLAQWGEARPDGADTSAAPTGEAPEAPLAESAKSEGVWLALFANFDEPIRFEPVTALAESFTQGEDRAAFAAKRLGTRDGNLVQILLDEKAYAKGKADITLAAEQACERLKGVLGGTLQPGEYAGVAYPDSEGGVHQLLLTPLDHESQEPSEARIDPGESGEPVMTIAAPEPREPDADL